MHWEHHDDGQGDLFIEGIASALSLHSRQAGNALGLICEVNGVDPSYAPTRFRTAVWRYFGKEG